MIGVGIRKSKRPQPQVGCKGPLGTAAVQSATSLFNSGASVCLVAGWQSGMTELGSFCDAPY